MTRAIGIKTVADTQHNAPRSFGTRVSLLTDDTPTIQLWNGRAPPAPPGPVAAEPAPGSILCSRYVLEQVMGRGGTSVVFRARDLRPGAPRGKAANVVALKLLHAGLRANPIALTQLSREFRQMQCLSHRGIVRVFDMDCDGEVSFISMELVAGGTVNSWMHTPASDSEAFGIITQCCEALEYAHSLGILHGDVKPSNVLLASDGTAKLIDFGSTPNPGGGTAVGFDASVGTTPLYASPQILDGLRAERRDDIFSLACLSYSILSRGRHPFGGHPSFEDGRAKSAPTYVRAIPPALFEVIERGLSAERERRPASVREFLALLTAAERRQRAATTSVATVTRPEPGTAGDTPSRSTAPTLLRQIRLTARSLARPRAAGAALVAFDGFDGHRSPDRNARSFARLIVAILAIAGATEFLQLHTRRDVIAAADVPAAVAATLVAPASAAGAQSETMPQSEPPAHEAGLISFEGPTVHASAGQSMVAISVKRLQDRTGNASFAWRVERGSAQPGIDYERVEPRTARFIEGQAVRTLFIPLINTRAPLMPRGPLTFTVALERVAGGPALGRFARITVAIDPPPSLSRVAVCCRATADLSMNTAR
jgi:serine/threonine protein kinase